MKMKFTSFASTLRSMSLTALAVLASCSSYCQAEPDYDLVGKQFSMVLQNAHFSRTRFTQELYATFLDQYIKSVDPQHLFLSQEDVKFLKDKYATSFGDYLLANQTTRLAEELYSYFSERALARINQADSLLDGYAKEMPAFDSDRTIARVRRKQPRAANAAELDQLWKDQVEDMVLSEVIRRENVAKLAKEQGKDAAPKSKEMAIPEKLKARLKRIRNDIQEADREDMVTYVLHAVASTYDPHTDYMGARVEQKFKDRLQASLVGIGAQLKADDDGSTTVEGIVKGGPAAKSGELNLGDHIVAVAKNGDDNFTDIMYMGIDKVVDLIRGEKGKPVKMRVINDKTGQERLISIVRDEVPMSETLASARVVEVTVPAKEGVQEKSYRLGIINLPQFYVGFDNEDVHCCTDVKLLVNRMVKEGVQGIVFDLRGNTGGSLVEVRKMVGLFTGSGPVVQVKNARGYVERLTASGKPIFDGQMVILIDKMSASASEIFAGAMTDYGRALIAGEESSHGKGSVQEPREMSDFMPLFSASREGCGMLKITTQKFYRINGASNQRRGVPSDIVLPTGTTGLPIGEAEEELALPYDEIAPAPGYVKNPHLARILPQLKERCEARVAENQDLSYMKEDAARVKERLDTNKVSLNKAKRVAESEKLLARRKEINEERKVRYAKMEEEDARNMKIYRLNLSDVNAETLPIATKEDKNNFMEEAEEDEDDNLVEQPDFPSDLDPVLREGLNIVQDMIDLR